MHFVEGERISFLDLGQDSASGSVLWLALWSKKAMMDLLNRAGSWTIAKPARAAAIGFLFIMVSFCLTQLLVDTGDFLDRFWRDILIALPIAVLAAIAAYLRAKQWERRQEQSD